MHLTVLSTFRLLQSNNPKLLSPIRAKEDLCPYASASDLTANAAGTLVTTQQTTVGPPIAAAPAASLFMSSGSIRTLHEGKAGTVTGWFVMLKVQSTEPPVNRSLRKRLSALQSQRQVPMSASHEETDLNLPRS